MDMTGHIEGNPTTVRGEEEDRTGGPGPREHGSAPRPGGPLVSGFLFPMTTADGCEWQVFVEPCAIEVICRVTRETPARVADMLPSCAHHLEFAALRAIARGESAPGRVTVTAATVRV